MFGVVVAAVVVRRAVIVARAHEGAWVDTGNRGHPAGHRGRKSGVVHGGSAVVEPLRVVLTIKTVPPHRARAIRHRHGAIRHGSRAVRHGARAVRSVGRRHGAVRLWELGGAVGAVAVRLSHRREGAVGRGPVGGPLGHVRSHGLVGGGVQSVGSATKRDTTQSLAGDTALSTVGCALAEGITAVVARVVGAARNSGHVLGGGRGDVPVVVDAGSASSADVSTAASAGTSVDDGSVVGVVGQCGAHLATGRDDARLLGEVIAVNHAAGHDVGQGALSQPAAGSVDTFLVPDAIVAGRVLLATNGSTITVNSRTAAHAGVDVAGVIADAGGVIGARSIDINVEGAADGLSVPGVREGKAAVDGALATSLKVNHVIGGSSVARGCSDAGANIILNIAHLTVIIVAALVREETLFAVPHAALL